MTVLVNPIVRRVETADERYTHEDFMRLAPEDRKAELIDGEMIIMPPPFDIHERLQEFLAVVIGFFVSRFGLGHVRGSRTAVYISETETYEPDLLFVSQAREYIITQRELTEAPDLVVEILSAGTARHDRGRKLQGYSKAGVQELWLIDPYGPTGTNFYQRQEDKLVEVVPVDGIIHSTILPNFKLKVAWLWADARGQLPNPVDMLKALGAL